MVHEFTGKLRLMVVIFLAFCQGLIISGTAAAQTPQPVFKPAIKQQPAHKTRAVKKMTRPLYIVQPAVGSRYCTGSQMKLVWKSSLKTAEPVRLDVYDGNTLFYTISARAANNGQFLWTIPAAKFNKNIHGYTLRITTIKSKIWSVSPVFYIGKPGMAVVSPTSNQIVKKRLTLKIQWTQGCFAGAPPSSYSLVLLNASKSPVLTLNGSMPRKAASPQSFSWLVPDSLNNERYYIQIRPNAGNEIVEQPILIASMPHPWQSDKFTVTKPTGNLYWCKGQSLDIRWQSGLSPATKVNVWLLKNNYDVAAVLASSTNNDGQFTAVPPSGLYGATYHIAVGTPDQVYMTESGANIIYRDRMFSVEGPGNTGVWHMGENVTFSYWLSNCFSASSIKLQLIDANNAVAAEIATVSGGFGLSKGSRHPVQWTVPVSLNPGVYRLKILDPGSGAYATSMVNIAYPQ